MVKGLFQKLNYPYAQFVCANLSADLLFDPVWEAISRLERLGFKVLAITRDGASANRHLWKLAGEMKQHTKCRTLMLRNHLVLYFWFQTLLIC